MSATHFARIHISRSEWGQDETLPCSERCAHDCWQDRGQKHSCICWSLLFMVLDMLVKGDEGSGGGG